MKQHHKLTLVLCVVWVVSLLYGEFVSFRFRHLFSCSWPHHLGFKNSMADGVTSPTPGDYVKVAVITDPQLMDSTSLSLPRKSFALGAAQVYTDLYMRRAFFGSVLPFKPDVILFLGDYFDGGFVVSSEEWQDSLRRFRHIFGLDEEGKYDDIDVHYIPGNHDMGYANVIARKPQVVDQYEKAFGRRNYRFTIGTVEFIAIDAQSIDGNPRGKVATSTWEFVKNASKDVQVRPRVLLTHVPLYRRDNTDCGKNRYSPVINQRIHHDAHVQEISYQNYVTEESSQKLLDIIKPALILSGHDHDQCTLTHQSSSGPATEHTVGTISWQQGNLYPSFMLLSVLKFANTSIPGADEALMTQLCFLPPQLHIYIWYIFLFALTILSLLFWPTNGFGFFDEFFASLGQFSSILKGTKEKTDDEDCEYEMMWDAEGAMHLVKKARDTSSLQPTDKASVERGNAVMRPTARKLVPQESEISMDIDPIVKRTSKSKRVIVIQRMVRTFQMVAVIASVNLPLYMMLLFKDSID